MSRYLGILWIAMLACLNVAGAADAKRSPNIIFILADDLGYGDLGCYGQQKIKTPNLDRMAAEGMRFTSGYAGCTVCAPSRCTLMTGKHTGHAIIRGNMNPETVLRPEDLTVAELLQRAHYTNACVGKWGLGFPGTTGVPTKKGFKEFFGYYTQLQAHDYYPARLGRGEEWIEMPGNQNGQRGDYSPDWFTRGATNYLRDAQGGPFFLYLCYPTPHANNEETRATGNGMQVPSDAPYANETWPQPEKNKAAMITRMDADIGKILDRLKFLRLDNDTIVLFSSDNGPHKEGGNTPDFFASRGPLRGIKRDLYEGGIRVPFIVRWPGHIQPGTVSDLPVAFWDFLATAAELSGQKVPADTDGVSFLPTLLGQPQTKPHEFLYWEFHEGATKQAVRMGDWKGVRLAPGTPLELYNLKVDIGETMNVADANPTIIAKLEAYLKTARTESENWPIKSTGAKKKK